MKKLSLAVISLFTGILLSFSQTADTGAYKNRRLKIEEVNFIASYYHQEGNLSPITGGFGSQKLSDYATSIELKMNRWDKKNRKHEVNGELGVEYYTSASSDKIDYNISSASRQDVRYNPSGSLLITNEKKGTSTGAYGAYSIDSHYASYGLGASFGKTSKDKNSEFSIKVMAYLDRLKLIYPIELRTGPPILSNKDYPKTHRNSFSSSLTFSQVINKKLQMQWLLDLVYQQGYLSTPYHRIYFSNGAETIERLPSSRFKVPLGMRVNYFAGDKIILRLYYRFYADDWGLLSHTASLEVPVKVTPFLSFSPFYRFYYQNGVKYFAPYGQHLSSEEFYTTDDDLSPFMSNYEGLGIRYAPPGGVFKKKRLNTLEIRYGHYERTNGLTANIVSLNLKVR